MSTIRKARPKDGPAAHRQTVIDALGMANLGSVDLMKVRTQEDAERTIALWRRRADGPEECTTASGAKLHYRRDRHRTLCGFKAADLNGAHPGELCAMCVNIDQREST